MFKPVGLCANYFGFLNTHLQCDCGPVSRNAHFLETALKSATGPWPKVECSKVEIVSGPMHLQRDPQHLTRSGPQLLHEFFQLISQLFFKGVCNLAFLTSQSNLGAQLGSMLGAFSDNIQHLTCHLILEPFSFPFWQLLDLSRSASRFIIYSISQLSGF